MLPNKSLFLPVLMSVVEMAIPDKAMLQKFNSFTKNGELVYEFVTDLMDSNKEGKEKYWINRIYGFIKQGALSMKEEDVNNIHKAIVEAIEKLNQAIKEKKKCSTVSFSLTYFNNEVYLQIAEIKQVNKRDMKFNLLASCKLRKAIYAIVNAIMQSDDPNNAWDKALSSIFPEFSTIKLG